MFNICCQNQSTTSALYYKGQTALRTALPNDLSKDKLKFNMEVTPAELVLIEHALACMNEHQETLPLLNKVRHLLSLDLFPTPHGPPSGIGDSER